MTTKLHYCSSKNSVVLTESGFYTFDDYWNLPHEFVERINFRRKGWSGVSVLEIAGVGGERRRFYVKRQENQSRYSWRYPLGALTFLYEVEAVQKVNAIGLPGVELAAYGFRKSGRTRQGVLVTCEIEPPSFAWYEKTLPDWSKILPQLRIAGRQLCRFHTHGWQHGAFYPAHLFINGHGDTRLIDFERTRHRSQSVLAAEADFIQFFRRSQWVPDEALAALMEGYRATMPALFSRLAIKFPERIHVLKE